ncbi:MAG: hypothetical protein M5U34_01165 [Chloroflexi bacterium]|nr:hypothetical protein [Chloroflexota bacterium]
MSSHHLPEVTQVCSEIVILNRGQIDYQNKMEEALAARSYIRIRVNKSLANFEAVLTAVSPASKWSVKSSICVKQIWGCAGRCW